MPPKPHRLLLTRVTGYADEASAFMRRRRIAAPPVRARQLAGRRSAAFDAETAEGRELFRAAAHLIDVAGDGGEGKARVSALVDPELAARVLERALARGGEFAELYCEESATFSIGIDESRVERPQSGAERGAGVRVLDGETAYFAHVDGLGEAELMRAADAAAAALSGERTEPRRARAPPPSPRCRRSRPAPATCPPSARPSSCAPPNEIARAQGDARSPRSPPPTREGRRRVAVVNSEGVNAADDRTRVRFGAQVVARRNGTVETGFETLGGHRGFELVDGGAAERIAEQAARKALTLLDAGDAPAGSMPVVVGGGFGGVLFHEMTGHGLEADAVQKGASVYAERMGEAIAASHLNAYDDGRLPGEWGTNAIDDEGAPTRRRR